LKKIRALAPNSASGLLKGMPMCDAHSTKLTVLEVVELSIVIQRKGGNRAVGFCPARVCRFFKGVGWL
jgi:hypothetical protein